MIQAVIGSISASRANSIPKPTGLTLSLISGGVKIDFTDQSSGIADHEIYGKSDSGVYTLITTLAAGTVTYNNICSPVDLRYYKVRAKIGTNYSAYTTEESIAMLSAELLAGWTNLGAYPFETFTSNGRNIDSAINTTGGAACYSNPLGVSCNIGEKFLYSFTGLINSGIGRMFYIGSGGGLSQGSNAIILANGDISGTFTIYAAYGTDLVYESNQLVDFSAINCSLKKVLNP